MHRIAFALALTAFCAPALAAQQVSTELYGDFRYSYNRADAGDATYWTAVNNASRFGVRARAEGSGLTVFADLQTGVNVDAGSAGGIFTQRYYLAGVRGGFGTVTLGRHSTAYKMAGLRLDPFYDTSTLSAGGGVPSTGLFAGASFGLSNLTNGWTDRALTYTSPALGGITGYAAAYLDTESEHDYGLGAEYRSDGLGAGVQYYDAGSDRNWAQTAGVDHALRGHASYTRSGWSLGATYERLQANDGDRQGFFFASGTMEATPELTVAAAVGHVDDGPVHPVAGTGIHAGVFYTLLPGARVHALYSRVDPTTGAARSNLALGLTYGFSLRQP